MERDENPDLNAFDDDVFAKAGLSRNTVNLISNSHVPKKPKYKIVVQRDNFLATLEPVWRELQISTGRDGRRRFAGELTTFFKKVAEKYNSSCVFAFKSNNIKQVGSRKHTLHNSSL